MRHACNCPGVAAWRRAHVSFWQNDIRGLQSGAIRCLARKAHHQRQGVILVVALQSSLVTTRDATPNHRSYPGP